MNLPEVIKKPGPRVNGCWRVGTVDEEKDVGQAGDNVDKLDGKIQDDTAGAVNVFTNERTKMGLPVLGVCTADGRCVALEEATSELETAKGRLDESVSRVDGRDDTRDCT